ncbi:hypothetical protein ABK040_008791 [Willaertia magna]
MTIHQKKKITNITWNRIISGLSFQNESIEDTLFLFENLQKECNFIPDEITIKNILNLCAEHNLLSKAINIFTDMKNRYKTKPDEKHYSCIFKAYIKNNKFKEVKELFFKMEKEGITIKHEATFVLLLNNDYIDLNFGKKLHSKIKELNLKSISLFTTLINMYSKFRCKEEFCNIFENEILKDNSIKPNHITLISILNAYADNEMYNECEEIFLSMQDRFGIEPDVSHYGCIIKAYIKSLQIEKALYQLNKLEKTIHSTERLDGIYSIMINGCSNLAVGKQLHDIVKIKPLLLNNIEINNNLIGMYARCGDLNQAIELFNNRINKKKESTNIYTWTIMIDALGKHNKGEEALDIYKRMLKETNIVPNTFTLSSILNACAESGLVQVAIHIFNSMKDFKILNDVHYACLIKALVKVKRVNEAMNLLKDMDERDIKPTEIIYSTLLLGCAETASLTLGKQLHFCIKEREKTISLPLINGLIDMYAKCGDLEESKLLFNQTKEDERDVMTWTAMINAFGQHGKGKEAIHTFYNMLRYTNPNETTFVVVLNACSHSGLVDDGLEIFEMMKKLEYVELNEMHYNCIVDMLGRSRRLDEAEKFIKENIKLPGITTWMTLLASCRTHNDLERAERVFSIISKHPLEGDVAAAHVLMSNIYSFAGMPEKSKNIRKLMDDNNVKKIPGKTFIEIDGVTHSFICEDKHHPQIEKIYNELDKLNNEMIEAGYVPDTSWVTRNNLITEEEKKRVLCLHSEKIALVYGLMNTAPGTTLTITKNLRVCGDCHNATKFISKLKGREIIVRDANRFHHFKDGKCSCNDYW